MDGATGHIEIRQVNGRVPNRVVIFFFFFYSRGKQVNFTEETKYRAVYEIFYKKLTDETRSVSIYNKPVNSTPTMTSQCTY